VVGVSGGLESGGLESGGLEVDTGARLGAD
jgi:hypothetical protein